jgi:fibronectin-binding autotransporter adhesin
LNVSGFDGSAVLSATKASEAQGRWTVMATSGSGQISGEFDAVTGVSTGTSGLPDYLVFGYGKDSTAQFWQIGYGLAWFANPPGSHGTFTVDDGDRFIVDVGLTDQTPNGNTGWDGSTLDKNGGGDLVLAGDQTGVGAVNVNDGTLLVDGTTGHPGGGPFIIWPGAIGGGEGVINTDVLVKPGGTISPGGVVSGSDINTHVYGDPADDAGTLVITGDLTMEPGALADFTLGQADYPAQPWNAHDNGIWNDLLVVGGDLVLDGVLNVKETPGSPAAGFGFKPGRYEVIHYGGDLTDNGLSIGTLPNNLIANKDVYLQTSVDHYVNLIVMGNSKPDTTGTGGTGPGGDTWPTDPDGDRPVTPGGSGPDGSGPVDPDNLHNQVVWWDGAPNNGVAGSARNDGTIGGGNGIWNGWNSVSGSSTAWGNDNWTTGSDYSKGPGYVNAAWEAYAYAHFTTTGGTVTIDNTTAGQVKASGAEFHVSGYIITGGDLLIGGTSDAVFNTNNSGTTTLASNVRDYSSAGSQYITGLTKTGAGALVMSGTSSYKGATNVNAGRLIVSGAITGTPEVNVLAGAVLTDNGVIGNGTTNVNVAGTFSGNGTVNGSVVAQNGGVISPGAAGNNGVGSIGRLTIERDLQLLAGSTLKLDIGGPAGPANAGLTYDSLTVGASGGAITLAGELDLSLNLANLNIGDYFTLIDNRSGAAIAGDFASIILGGLSAAELASADGAGTRLFTTLSGLTVELSRVGDSSTRAVTGGNDLVLTLLAIPEPGTWAMLAGGLAVLALAKRPRRTRRQAA